jgi:hypothetical protein
MWVVLTSVAGVVVSQTRFRDVLLLHSAYTLDLLERAVAESGDQFEQMIDGGLFADGQALKTAGKQPVL